MDLEQRLGQSVLISQIGDVVLGHCPHFRSLYVPYVTNMMYQEALVNQLLLVSIYYISGDLQQRLSTVGSQPKSRSRSCFD